MYSQFKMNPYDTKKYKMSIEKNIIFVPILDGCVVPRIWSMLYTFLADLVVSILYNIIYPLLLMYVGNYHF